MRDEDEALAVVDPARSASNPVRGLGAEHRRQRLAVAFPFFLCSALQQEAAIVLCFGALDIEFHPARGLVEFFKDVLELFGGDEVDGGAAAGRHQGEDTP